MTQTFCDNQGWIWTLQLNFAFVRRIKSRLGFDMIEPSPDPQWCRKLSEEPETFFGFLECLLEEQATTRGLDTRKPGWMRRRLRGKCLTAAAWAVMQDITAFFQRCGREAASPTAENLLLIAEAYEEPTQEDGSPSTSLPATSESTQTD